MTSDERLLCSKESNPIYRTARTSASVCAKWQSSGRHTGDGSGRDEAIIIRNVDLEACVQNAGEHRYLEASRLYQSHFLRILTVVVAHCRS